MFGYKDFIPMFRGDRGSLSPRSFLFRLGKRRFWIRALPETACRLLLHNVAAERGQQVVLTCKGTAYPEHGAVLDIERGVASEIRDLPWQTGTSVSWKSWGYIDNDSFKPSPEIVHEFVDVVSKNGNLSLNVRPKPDGVIPEQAEEIFRSMGRRMDVNGEAIYGTRPWKIYGEGPTSLASGSFAEKKLKELTFTPQDIRLTTRGDEIYAIFMAWSEHQAKIKGSRTLVQSLTCRYGPIPANSHPGGRYIQLRR